MREKLKNYYAYIDYYALGMLILFIIYNLLLKNLTISGVLYQLFAFTIMIMNAVVLIVFRKKIKYKTLIIVAYLIVGLFSKGILQFILAFSNITLLCITGFMESHFIKFISILLVILCCIFILPVLVLFTLMFNVGLLSLDEDNSASIIYEDMHYYCDNNNEVYAYSGGAMDRYHYSIGKHYEFLNIKGIISISYGVRNDKTETEYEEYLKKHTCKLVDDKK